MCNFENINACFCQSVCLSVCLFGSHLYVRMCLRTYDSTYGHVRTALRKHVCAHERAHACTMLLKIPMAGLSPHSLEVLSHVGLENEESSPASCRKLHQNKLGHSLGWHFWNNIKPQKTREPAQHLVLQPTCFSSRIPRWFTTNIHKSSSVFPLCLFNWP